jgi:bifunctional polynucleotide phosphatase/kinase
MSFFQVKENNILVHIATPLTENPAKPLYLFDLDYTLIKTKSGAKFPKDENDWKFMVDIEELRKCFSFIGKTHNIGIITNQSGLKTEKDIRGFEKKLTDIIITLKHDISIFVSIKHDEYRKPYPGFLNMLSLKYPTIVPYIKKSIYIGDAAGRSSDHAQSDYAFAKNFGLDFLTPEQFYKKCLIDFPSPNNEPPKLSRPDFDIYKSKTRYALVEKIINILKNEKTMVIMVGSQASGKSSLATSILSSIKDVIVISNDETGSLEKSKILFNKSKGSTKSIIIDNTNSDNKTRQYWLNSAKENGYSTMCIWFNYPKEIGKYLLHYRNYLGSKYIPEIAINMYYSKFEAPKEGDYDYFIEINKLFFELQELYF